MLGKVDTWPNYQHLIALIVLPLTHVFSENIKAAKAFIFIELPFHRFYITYRIFNQVS